MLLKVIRGNGRSRIGYSSRLYALIYVHLYDLDICSAVTELSQNILLVDSESLWTNPEEKLKSPYLWNCMDLFYR